MSSEARLPELFGQTSVVVVDQDVAQAQNEVVSAELFGQAGVMVEGRDVGPAPSEYDHVAEWSRAFECWLSERAIRTQEAYAAAWKDHWKFLGITPRRSYEEDWRVWFMLAFAANKMPDVIYREDIMAWKVDMEARPLSERIWKGLAARQPGRSKFGLSPSTINQYLAAVSSFYLYVMQVHEVTLPDGSRRYLHSGTNPVQALGRNNRPQVEVGSNAIYLDDRQIQALLKAIKKTTVYGLRDYAMFQMYLQMGLRNSVVRLLQKKQLVRIGGKLFLVWEMKREAGKDRVPPPVVRAINRYLKASGRSPVDDLEPDEYIFVSISERGKHLPKNRGVWLPGGPLSSKELNRRLKVHARKAGLDAGKIHVHTLRHSAFMGWKKAGASIEVMSKKLGHKSLETTMIYDHALEGCDDDLWIKTSLMYGIDAEDMVDDC